MGLPNTYTSLCRSCENCLHAELSGSCGPWICMKDIDEDLTDALQESQAVSATGSCDDFEWCDEAEAQIRIELDERFRR